VHRFFFSGETVSQDEQISLNDADETLSTTQSMLSLSTLTITRSDEWNKEHNTLYQQLDEKVNANVNREITIYKYICIVEIERMMKSII